MRFQPGKKPRIADQAVFDDLGQTGGEFPRRQRLQDIGIGEDQFRLPEGADHVLAEGVIDPGLAAYRRIDLGEQGGRDLDEGYATLIGGGGISGHGGAYTLLMLSSSPLIAASYLISKSLTRHDKPSVIVAWQSITVAMLSLPIAALDWTWPSMVQWILLLLCGLMGSTGHYCLTRAFVAADISATQPARFVDLAWSSAAGWIAFQEVPTKETLIGAAIILGGTTWLAQRERAIRMRQA